MSNPFPRLPGRAAALVLFLFVVPALMATAPLAAAQSPEPSAAELKAEAWDAQQALAEAERAEAAAKQAALEAEQRAAAARERAAQAASRAEAAPPAASVDPAELERLREQVREAREAARTAQGEARAARVEVSAQLAEMREAHEKRYARPGFFIAGGAAWAPELFDTDFEIDNARAGYVALGYRAGDRFEAEVRFDISDDFDVSGFGIEGDVDAWSATFNGRFFMLTGKFQPYVGIGLGATRFEAKLRDVATGEKGRDRETEMVFRPSAGFDFYVSETLALTADAALHVPRGDISHLRWATLGGGIKLRF